MPLKTLTFQPGTIASISKSGFDWTVDTVNADVVTVVLDDIDGNGTISGAEWDAAINGGGNDTGGTYFLFDRGGSSGTLYALDGTTSFTVGQVVTSIKQGLSNTFEANVTGVICLAGGTRIQTPTGLREIEELEVGQVVNLAFGGVAALRWVGRRCITPREMRENSKLLPIRISAGAMGSGLPREDLLVSRQHRMLVHSKISARMFGTSGVLIPAISLVGLPGIYVDTDITAIQYFHLLFDKHEIILANGAPTESLFTGPEALRIMSKAEHQEIVHLLPEIAIEGYQPCPARPIPDRELQKELIARHARNSKPLLQNQDKCFPETLVWLPTH